MNILLIISKNDRYGAQRIFLDQANVLHRMGNRVVVVGRGNEGYVPDSVRSMGMEYRGIPMKGLKDIFLLRQLVKNYTIDVIHTTLDRADYFGVLLSFFSRKPVVSTMMVPRYHIGFRFADMVVVLSNKQKTLLVSKGIKPDRIAVIRPGIDVERFAHPDVRKREVWRQKLNSDTYSLVFCHIASLIPRKAHTVSLDLLGECRKRGEKPLLIIIGDPLHGEYYDSLLKRIVELDLKDSVSFTGWTSDIPEILSFSHFTILPSEDEALGIVLMEGMASGTPVIAREGEGGAELVEEYRAGFLYEPRTGTGDLADKVVALQRNISQYVSLSDQCKNTSMNEFSLYSYGKKVIALYDSVV